MNGAMYKGDAASSGYASSCMRVLLINDVVSCGGTEVQHWREFDLLAARGHDVYSLTMDPNADKCLSGRKRNVPITNSLLGKTLSRTFSGVHLRSLKAQVNDIAPEVIHLNNVRKAPLDVYRIACDYPCIQTVRDYGAVCPKGTCIHGGGTQCPGYLFGDCSSCGLSAKERVKARQIKRLNRACIEACDALVAPSEALAHCCCENGLPTTCLNDAFDFSACGLRPERLGRKDRRSFLYFGSIDWIKGIGELLIAFDAFAEKHPDVQLVFAGGVVPSYVAFFESEIAKRGYATYVGKLPSNEMLDRVRESYCVVVPSLWIENYPNTVLEALSCRTLVIGTNRGGIPEMVRRPELLFDVLDTESIVRTLEFAYNLAPSEYEAIVDSGYCYVAENNTTERYAQKLEALFAEVVAESRHATGMKG